MAVKDKLPSFAGVSRARATEIKVISDSLRKMLTGIGRNHLHTVSDSYRGTMPQSIPATSNVIGVV
jgi:hypothetical protein